MPFRLRSRRKYNTLKRKGFMAFEAIYLSSIPSHVPYFNKMVSERQKEYNNAVRSGISSLQWKKRIYDKYNLMGWIIPELIKRSRMGGTRLDPWAMLRYYQDIWELKNKPYDSPWKKKPLIRKHIDRGQIKKRRESQLGKYDRLRGR